MQGFTILYLTLVVFVVAVYSINDDVKPINMYLRPLPVFKPRRQRSLLGPMPHGYSHNPIEPWAEQLIHVPDSSIDSYRHPAWAFGQPLPVVRNSYQNNFKSLFEHVGPFEKETDPTDDSSGGLTPENDINKLLALHLKNIQGGEYKQQQQQVLPEDNISVQLLANVYHHYPALPTVEPTVVYELNMPIVVVQESKKKEETPFPWFYTTPRQDTEDVETIVPATESPSTAPTTSSDYLGTTEPIQETTTNSYSVFIDELETSSPTEPAGVPSDEERLSVYTFGNRADSKEYELPAENIENETTAATEMMETEGTTESYIGEIVDNISQEFPSDAHNVINNVWGDVEYV